MKQLTERPTDDHQEPIAGDDPIAIPQDEAAIVAPPEIGRRVFQPRTLLGFLIAAVVLYFFYKRGLDLDFREVWARMRGANAVLLLLTFVVYYTSFIFRTLRWRTLLANVGYSRERGVPMPSALGLCEILYLSLFANCVTVARLGDAYRGYMLKRSAGVSFTVTIGTILAERLIDLVVLAGLMAVSIFVAFRGILPAGADQALIGGVALAAIGLLGLASLRRLRPIIERVLPERLFRYYDGVESGIVVSLRLLPLLTGFSIAGWLIEGATLYLTAAALGAPLSIVGAIVVALVASLLTTIPFTPAGLGFTEAGMVLILKQLGLDDNAAGAIALLNRVVNYWSIVVFGAILYIFSRKK